MGSELRVAKKIRPRPSSVALEDIASWVPSECVSGLPVKSEALALRVAM